MPFEFFPIALNEFANQGSRASRFSTVFRAEHLHMVMGTSGAQVPDRRDLFEGTSSSLNLAGNGNRGHLLAEDRKTNCPLRFVLQGAGWGRGDP